MNIDEIYNPESQLEDFYIPEEHFRRGSKVTSPPKDWDELPDLEYFRQKMLRAGSPEAAEKYRRQLELLEDAVLIYREERLPQFDLTAVRLHALPYFPFEHARVRDFLKKVLDL